jgi:hypothetical protein
MPSLRRQSSLEVQLSVDEDKQYAWPAYVANLRARIRRPVHLLVITWEESVARWARKPIELGGGSRVIAWVTGPRDIPLITDLRQAEEHVELAVLSALAHGGDADIEVAARVAFTAIFAIATVDAERWKTYADFLMKFLPESVIQALKAMSNPVVREYLSDFARGYVAQGRAEGKLAGRAEANEEAVVRLLTWRFGPLTEAIQTRVRDACSRRSDVMPDCVLSAKTLDEAIGLL